MIGSTIGLLSRVFHVLLFNRFIFGGNSFSIDVLEFVSVLGPSSYLLFKIMGYKLEKYFCQICDSFMISLYNMFKNQTTSKFSQGSLNSIKEIGNWFVDNKFSYFKIYGCERELHLLPRYVLDRLVPREITYQRVFIGIATSLFKGKKRQCP